MRIRRLAHCSLVGGLIVNVRSAKNCSVCGDGYQVGSPSTMTSVRCSVLSDSLCTCNQLQLAGFQGLIAIEKCFNISLLIFETCDCQENTSQNANDSQHQTSPPVAAPIATPHHPSLVVRPVAAPSFYPTPDAFRPTTYAPVPNAAPTLIDSLGFQLHLAIWAIALLTCCWCCCRGCIESICSNCCIGRSPDQISRADSRRNTQEMLQNMPPPPLTRPMSSYRMDLGRRPLVLATLFPNEAKVEGQGTPGGLSLKYDPQSKQYVFSEDTADANSCSICLEILAPEDDTVTGLCSHVYHRACIMNWFQDYHDECPNCRQPMWDPETYNMIDQSIQDQENSGP